MKGEKAGGAVTYRMHVIAGDAAELAANAGGLIVDRMMSGWRVSAQLLENSDAPGDNRSVQILGAELVEDMESSAGEEGEQCVLVIGADSYDRVIADDARQLPAGLAEVLVWGRSPDPTCTFGHNLSAAALAFKTQAVAAAQLTDGETADEVAVAESFTSMNVKGGGVPLRA
ncbi:hypothetical protein VST63_28695 [Mycolicibacterium sp. 050232]|uniref:hypothetical protein n=1 Tax=Mycolicibacterium sp. 050232 TaxID=3113982 RepID=UPI002E2AD812|nr:hypothetical protein [Mycolicibacterium sp. 050232]MED5816357.1 hypothetical protein [Mycolicibacterium sp. 050232]